MSKEGNKRKARQLGMPYGTACNRLRKQVMFLLLCKLGENVCVRCNGDITTVEQLSLEHKIAWLDNDVVLFWDLNNIAFSHLSCNISAGRRPTKKYMSDEERQDAQRRHQRNFRKRNPEKMQRWRREQYERTGK